ncbi:hypothetical protein [Neorhizobium huautlense]|uniref:hypothetical protein n=1 Tax=Neorhizobium huautlense TaxID=67774 RepID=UPI0013006129|nr:hypothetical protein [Neorhizobium huautlense]
MEWEKVLQAVDDDPKGASIDDHTLQNLAALVRYGEAELLPPSTVGKGYYPSAVIDWDNLQKQIEVFEDRFEIYDFSPVPTAIQHVVVEKLGQLPDQLLPLLKPLKR